MEHIQKADVVVHFTLVLMMFLSYQYKLNVTIGTYQWFWFFFNVLEYFNLFLCSEAECLWSLKIQYTEALVPNVMILESGATGR